ncbi:TMEM175 family protein [Oryzibacter oryziterrae]|uniref:TMEM175 family protein n=1 Tax=Oryzibacter oryziterrae TaxID=2766474 RepID=UPI001F01C592|nr:TMEM175 family protein [Oryzibacter oryziterrae]
MRRGRMEAFSDGVIAIIITIMVLELKVPEGHELTSLLPLAPKFYSYALSFLYVAIYWVNHHHLLHTVEKVSAPILWHNNLLLFWLSLVPFTTAWVGESNFAAEPMIAYGFVLLMCGVFYFLLSQSIVRTHGRQSTLARAIGVDVKGIISVVAYLAAIGLCFVWTTGANILYAAVALMWLIPDRRIERLMAAIEQDVA